jgi:tetratricopeptide (TPR) repeat protein
MIAMKCPICDYEVSGDELRCPQCHKALTSWRNLNEYAEQAFAAGLHALDAGTPHGAVEMFLRASVFAPNQARYVGAYGRLLVQLGRSVEGAELLSRAVSQDPSPQNQTDLDAARKLADEPAADEAAPPAGIEPLGLGAICWGEGVEVADPWKTALFAEQNWNRFAPFEGILSCLPNSEHGGSAAGRYLLGLAALQRGAVEESRTHFRAVAKLDSSLANPDVYLLFLADGADLDAEISQLQALGRSGEQLSRCLELAAQPYMATQPDHAHHRLLRAVRLAEGERAAVCRKLAEASRTPRALQTACEAWEGLPVELEVLLLAGDGRAHLKQADLAEQLYRKALDSYPDDWAPRERLAILLQERAPQAALTYLREALALTVSPDERAALLWLLSSILMRREDWIAARETLQELVSLRPESAEYRAALGDCCRAEAMSSATADLPAPDIEHKPAADSPAADHGNNPWRGSPSTDASTNAAGPVDPPKSDPN